MNDILFVKGGTPKSPKNNRMKELAPELGAYEFQEACVRELQNLIEEGTLEQYKDFFDKCQQYDVHIVGSRDKVYRSSQMSLLIGYLLKGDAFVLRSITRSLGLRDALSVQFNEENV